MTVRHVDVQEVGHTAPLYSFWIHLNLSLKNQEFLESAGA